MSMLNVKYFLSTQPINYPGLIEVKQARMKSGRGNIPSSLYRLENYQKRAWFVKEVEVYPDDNFPWKKITSQNYETRIYVRGDKSIAYGRVMGLMSKINSAGYRKVALITQTPKK